MAKLYKVKNIEEASLLLNKFQKIGKYNLFRGQSRNWEVVSSAARLKDKEFENHLENLKFLYKYFFNDKVLEKYTKNIDEFFAIAQHYGFPTNYIDFTSDYEVALFFATNSSSNKFGEDCSIICLNENDINNFFDKTKIMYKNFSVPPQIIKVDVDNLWRLQAQKGQFLFTPISHFERYYDFDRILFPFESPFSKIDKEKIYPKNKSDLELYLDYFFNAMKRNEGRIRLENFAQEMKIPITSIPKLNYNSYLKNKKPHHSWNNNVKEWNPKLIEHWEELNQIKIINIKIPSKKCKLDNFLDDSLKYLLAQIENNSISRKDLLKFNLINKNVGKKNNFKITQSCTRIWDVTRNLPFSFEEICFMISKYIFLEIFEINNKRTYDNGNDELITLEITNDFNGITRCFSHNEKIMNAFRDDIDEIIIDELKKIKSSQILLYINNPRIIFDFNKLLKLFIDEIIPYQVVYNSENVNPVIFYSPEIISILGYA